MPFKVTKGKVRIWESLKVDEVTPLHAKLCRLGTARTVVDLTALEEVDLAGLQLLLAARRSWSGLRFELPKNDELRETLRMWGIA
jgi:ABC-type transporter Mla MlaB component